MMTVLVLSAEMRNKMDINFIDESQVPKKGRAGTTVRNIEPFLKELAKYPNQWAIYNDPVKHSEITYLRKKFPKYKFIHTKATETLYASYLLDN